MKDKGLWDECSMVCYPKINSRILKGDADADLKKMVEIEKSFRVGLSRGRTGMSETTIFIKVKGDKR